MKHQPKEKTPPDVETLVKFQGGRSFEATFKATFQMGVAVDQILKKDLYSLGASYTQKVFEQSVPANTFEACFIFNKTLVMTDVCQIHENGSYTIFEVKNSMEEKEVFIQDMAIQYFVCSHAQKGLKQFNLVLPAEDGGFRIIDKTEVLKQYVPKLELLIPEFIELLKMNDEPDIAMGEQCYHPYKCEFIEYCTKELLKKSELF
ncbi:MAG TPA: hypothetical protein PKX92_01210 [Edaphocola sp.]|nr:hypothetical protein [Edaphocola sp.]